MDRLCVSKDQLVKLMAHTSREVTNAAICGFETPHRFAARGIDDLVFLMLGQIDDEFDTLDHPTDNAADVFFGRHDDDRNENAKTVRLFELPFSTCRTFDLERDIHPVLESDEEVNATTIQV